MKKLFVLLLSVCLLLSLASCGKKDDNASVPPQQSGNEDPSGEPGESGEPESGLDTEGSGASLLPDPESTGGDMEDLGEDEGSPQTVKASHSDVTLHFAGDTFQLSVQGLEGFYACTFASDDPDVASVDEVTGEVTAVSPGTAVISLSVEGESGQYDFTCIVRCAWTAELSGEDLLASLPEWFDFSSGAGAWSTELKIAADGTFTGLFSDSNAGESGEGYVATVYYCNFYGEFSTPVKVNDYTYSMTLESMHLVDEDGQESIDSDGVRWVASTPYGLEDAGEVLIYLPGAKLADLPEDFLNWTRSRMTADDPETLPFYGLYNVNEQLGFSGAG